MKPVDGSEIVPVIRANFRSPERLARVSGDKPPPFLSGYKAVNLTGALDSKPTFILPFELLILDLHHPPHLKVTKGKIGPDRHCGRLQGAFL